MSYVTVAECTHDECQCPEHDIELNHITATVHVEPYGKGEAFVCFGVGCVSQSNTVISTLQSAFLYTVLLFLTTSSQAMSYSNDTESSIITEHISDGMSIDSLLQELRATELDRINTEKQALLSSLSESENAERRLSEQRQALNREYETKSDLAHAKFLQACSMMGHHCFSVGIDSTSGSFCPNAECRRLKNESRQLSSQADALKAKIETLDESLESLLESKAAFSDKILYLEKLPSSPSMSYEQAKSELNRILSDALASPVITISPDTIDVESDILLELKIPTIDAVGLEEMFRTSSNLLVQKFSVPKRIKATATSHKMNLNLIGMAERGLYADSELLWKWRGSTEMDDNYVVDFTISPLLIIQDSETPHNTKYDQRIITVRTHFLKRAKRFFWNHVEWILGLMITGFAGLFGYDKLNERRASAKEATNNEHQIDDG
ncbi:hypothetical protein ACV4QK_20545 (plasmid) [Alteromonas macleodii]